MVRIAKLELYIILAALIIASLIIAIFWALNHGEATAAAFKQPPPAAADPADPDKDSDEDTDAARPSDSASASDSGSGSATGSGTGTASGSGSEKSAPNPVIEENKVTQQGLAQITEPTTVKALVFGDAVAASQGASNKDELGWHALVAKELQAKYPGNFQWAFKTTDQATVNDVSTYVPEVTPDTDLIILCLGRNDWTVLTTKNFKQKYEELLSELQALNPKADILIVIEPPVKNIEQNNKFFPYRQVLIELGKKHRLPVVDLWAAFIQDPAPLAELLADGVNPNDQGYRIFADGVLKGLERVLGRKN
ncbi:SGNH/GDSL hydrolase family protein [Desulfosporosinus meridiei]|uniref:Lysophospholipase L1-like esterase n=1 Tax=Desulfosporosinus meridiei (strain ATCC BAA-275 / DSM 13257 / KCTC 12902 / NCIMB 13706 / S10) TaxID=768704 RepID=J7IVY1_DESMD|nr:SGNH/GDSL hydrolase family protein [Desulfosporosinus meridiei]AFQ46002.1 lysophospholipase L1-like esterase [Desulfosporosinus meridiei DSM 13257]